MCSSHLMLSVTLMAQSVVVKRMEHFCIKNYLLCSDLFRLHFHFFLMSRPIISQENEDNVNILFVFYNSLTFKIMIKNQVD